MYIRQHTSGETHARSSSNHIQLSLAQSVEHQIIIMKRITKLKRKCFQVGLHHIFLGCYNTTHYAAKSLAFILISSLGL
jgi:hypothetical protein